MNLTYYESETFYSSLHHIFESENFRFPFCYKNSLNLEVKCDIKMNFRKSLGIYKITSKIVSEWSGHLEIFSRPKGIENSRQCLFLQTYFTESSHWVPLRDLQAVFSVYSSIKL